MIQFVGDVTVVGQFEKVSLRQVEDGQPSGGESSKVPT